MRSFASLWVALSLLDRRVPECSPSTSQSQFALLGQPGLAAFLLDGEDALSAGEGRPARPRPCGTATGILVPALRGCSLNIRPGTAPPLTAPRPGSVREAQMEKEKGSLL